jgi:hypothetical protein
MRGRTIDGHRVTIYGEHKLKTFAIDANGIRRLSEQTFFGAEMVGYDLILGWSWLETENPDCDWTAGKWYYREKHTPIVIALEPDQFRKELRNETQVFAFYMSPGDSMVSAGAQLFSLEIDDDPILPADYEDYADFFSEEEAKKLPDRTHTTHAIELEEDAKVPFGPIYHLSELELRVLRDYLASSEAKGWIKKSKSPAGAPILFIPKPDGSLRLCVDYRALNKITIKNRYPLPLISEIIDRLAGAKIYTKLDLRDAYHSIRIRSGDEWKTAFRTRYGHYEYTVMPFGLTNAPATFQAYVNEALVGLLDVLCVAFMDDICIYSDTVEEHADHVRQVLDRLRKAGLHARLSKCEFSVENIAFLGYRVGTAGVSMDPRKVQTILDWPVPENFRDIQVFLGFANFYRRFVLRYSKVVRPMTDLFKGMQKGRKTGPFEWPEEAQHAFEALKACFTTAPTLQNYEPHRKTRVETDASGAALSGILSQLVEQEGSTRGVWHPVAFWSRKLTAAERNYGTPDAELLAIVEAFKEWRPYLEGAQHTVEVISDHENLQYFMTTKVLNRRQAGWAERLAAFDFEIAWRQGVNNPADAPSRRPDYMRDVEERSQAFLPTLQNKIKWRRSLADHQDENTGIAVNVFTRRQVDAGSAVSAGSAGENQSLRRLPEQPKELFGSGEVPGLAYMLSRRDVNETTKGTSPYDAPHETLITLLGNVQKEDTFCKLRIWEDFPDHTIESGDYKGKWTVDRVGLVRCAGGVYVPYDPSLRQELLRLNHDDPWQGGHFGVARTIETLLAHYWWPSLKQDARSYIAGCDICQRMKVPRHKPYGLLNPLPMPDRPWQDISMDFITGLPPSGRRGKAYDAILVVVCRYSKMMRCIACTKTIDAPELAERLYEEIISKVGMPRSIVSDRGSIFTSKWWQTFCYYWGVKRRFSTAFRPQTDGQTERQNQTLETYLRCFVNYQQDDWTRMLPSGEYAYNSSVNATTGRSPFELVYRFIPNMQMNPPTEEGFSKIGAPDALDTVEEHAKEISEYKEIWNKAQETSKKYYDKKHKQRSYRIGSEVLLSSRNLKLRKPCKKLTDRFIGPFQVMEAVGENAYRLRLPKEYSRLHSTFHVSLLEPYHRREGVEPPGPTLLDDDEVFDVEAILDERDIRGEHQFLIKWEGYTKAYNSWEPLENLENVLDMIEAFRERKAVAEDARRQFQGSTRGKGRGKGKGKKGVR